MNRRKLIAGLFAVPFVALFGKLANGEKTLPRMEPAYYGETIPVVMGDKRVGSTTVFTYAYTWKQNEDGSFSDFKAIPSSTGVFTIPAEYAGQPVWIPSLDVGDMPDELVVDAMLMKGAKKNEDQHPSRI